MSGRLRVLTVGAGKGGEVVGEIDDDFVVERALAWAARRGRPPAVVAGDLTLIRPLGWAGIPVVAVVTAPDDVVLRSRFVQGHVVVPGYLGAASEETVALLCGLGARLATAVGQRVPLIYGQDSQLELIYRHRAALERHFRFVLNDESVAWALHDKAQFVHLCRAARVVVPPTVVPTDADADAALAALRPPLLVKPQRKADWKAIQRALFDGEAKARVFPSAEALQAHPAWAELRDRLVVQEHIEGAVTDLTSFHGFASEDGRLLASFCGRKLRTHPPVAGESALLELVDDPAVDGAGRLVAERLGLRGPFKVDLIRDPRSGERYTLEVNARFNLWHHLGAAHGVNLPLVAYEYMVDGREPPSPPRYWPNARWVNLYRDLQAFRADDSLSLPRWLASLVARPTIFEIFAWGDPLPSAVTLSRMVQARLARRADARLKPRSVP